MDKVYQRVKESLDFATDLSDAIRIGSEIISAPVDYLLSKGYKPGLKVLDQAQETDDLHSAGIERRIAGLHDQLPIQAGMLTLPVIPLVGGDSPQAVYLQYEDKGHCFEHNNEIVNVPLNIAYLLLLEDGALVGTAICDTYGFIHLPIWTPEGTDGSIRYPSEEKLLKEDLTAELGHEVDMKKIDAPEADFLDIPPEFADAVSALAWLAIESYRLTKS